MFFVDVQIIRKCSASEKCKATSKLTFNTTTKSWILQAITYVSRSMQNGGNNFMGIYLFHVHNKERRTSSQTFPAKIYLFRVNKRNTRKRYETCSTIAKKITNCEHISLWTDNVCWANLVPWHYSHWPWHCRWHWAGVNPNGK